MTFAPLRGNGQALTYRLTERADLDLFNMYLEGLHTFGSLQADIYYEQIKRVLDLIGEHPEIARERTEIRPPVHRHPHAEHLIVYEVDEAGILILRIRHRRENWEDDPIGF